MVPMTIMMKQFFILLRLFSSSYYYFVSIVIFGVLATGNVNKHIQSAKLATIGTPMELGVFLLLDEIWRRAAFIILRRDIRK